MMGHLFLINDSFETSNILESDRELVLSNFCKGIVFIKNYPDCLYATKDLYTRKFSYGDIFKFFYGSWSEIKSIPTLRGISSTVLEYYRSIMFATLSLSNEVNSRNSFEEQYANENFGYSGFDCQKYPTPYVKCDISWQEWKCKWLSTHQNEITWWPDDDNFLPNKAFTSAILFKEINNHGMNSKLSFYNGNVYNTFHEEIMKKKGPELVAYSKEICSKIARANYYKIDLQLSRAEHKASGGSLRAIYSLVGSTGKVQYLSIDHKHGMFEYHDHKGEHLGEYRFDGTLNKKVNPSHNLKTLR